jgi:hypothetical protein
MPRPSAAASRAGVQMQGFHPTVCGLPGASDRPRYCRAGRRAAGASRVAGYEAPLRLEGPAQTMRGVLAR